MSGQGEMQKTPGKIGMLCHVGSLTHKAEWIVRENHGKEFSDLPYLSRKWIENGQMAVTDWMGNLTNAIDCNCTKNPFFRYELPFSGRNPFCSRAGWTFLSLPFLVRQDAKHSPRRSDTNAQDLCAGPLHFLLVRSNFPVMGLFIKEKKRPGGQPKLLGHATADTQNTDVKKNKISFESEMLANWNSSALGGPGVAWSKGKVTPSLSDPEQKLLYGQDNMETPAS